MNRLKVEPSRPKKLGRVEMPGAAPPVGPAPRRLRSQSLAPQVNPPNTRDYGKPQPPVTPGFNLGGAI